MRLGHQLGIFFICIASSSAGFAQEPKDRSFEDSWYEINSRESFQPMPSGQWRARVGDRESEEYQVQRGDTLWGLSKTFFGNGYFWPKLWQVNSKFENPHQISPGQTIHFVSGGGDAPEVRVGDSAGEYESEDAVDSSLQTRDSESDDDVVIATEDGDVQIPAGPHTHAVLREIPASLPNLSNFYSKSKVSSAGIYLEKESPIREATDVPVRFFAMKNEPVSLGEVTGIDGGEISGPWKGIVYIKLQSTTPDSIAPGTKIRAFRASDILYHPANKKLLGREFDYTANLEVMDETNEPGIYRARVTFSVDEVKLGDRLAMGSIPHYRVSNTGALTEIPGVVIGSPYREEGKGEGLSHYIFLNIGAASGLRPNDHIPIFGVTATLKNGHEIFGKRGEAIVMDVSEELSSAIVFKSDTIVRVGDLVGASAVRAVKADANDQDDPMKQ